MALVKQPVTRRDVVVGTGHLDAGGAADGGRDAGGRGDGGVGPAGVGEDLAVGRLDVGRRMVVAAIHPEGHARVVAQAEDLRAQRLAGDGGVVGFPRSPALPAIAAAPAREDQNAHAIREVEESIALEFALEANGIEVHVDEVTELSADPFGRGTHEHVGAPAAAANEDGPVVDPE